MKLLLLGIIILSIYSMNVYGSESPWPMFKHDPLNTGQSMFKGSEENSLRWKFSTGARIQSSPAIASDGTVYIGSFDSTLYAINPNGTAKWKFVANKPIDSTPAVAPDGRIYFGSWDGNIYALEPFGKGIWRAQTSDQISSSPTIGPDGTIYIGSDDGFLYAVYLNGTLRWSFPTQGRIFSTPAVAPDGTVYAGSFDGHLYAINSDGELKWKFETDDGIFSSPAIASDGTIYFGSYDDNVYAMYPNGTLKWSFPTGGTVQGSPSIASDGTIYIGSFDRNLYAINPDGTKKWEFLTGDLVVSSPAIDSDGTIYVGSVDSFLYAITPDGKEKWRFKTDSRIFSSPAIASDGTIYFGSVDGNLYAIGKPLILHEGIPSQGSVNELVGYSGTLLYVVSTNIVDGKPAKEISIEVIMKNVDRVLRNFDPSSFKLLDVDGNEYTLDRVKSTLYNVRVASNDMIRGILYFESDTDISVSQLVYKDVRGVQLIVDLTNTKDPPDAEPMPRFMPGSNVDKKIIGENIEITIIDERFLESDPQQYIIQLSLRNKSNMEIRYDESLVYVKDTNGNVYLPVTSEAFSGRLKPGDFVNGDIIFRIPAHVSEVVFVYDDMATESYIIIPEFPFSIFAIAGAVSLLIILSRLRNEQKV